MLQKTLFFLRFSAVFFLASGGKNAYKTFIDAASQTYTHTHSGFSLGPANEALQPAQLTEYDPKCPVCRI